MKTSPRNSVLPSRTPTAWPRPPAAGAASENETFSAAGQDEATYDLTLLGESRARWDSSAGLRMVYGDIYRVMARLAAPGAALEIGSGAGTISDFLPEVVTSDIRPTPFVDRVASAYDLGSVDGAPWSTIYALDVLHHLREPLRFLSSAATALRPGGRIVVCDPAATLWGRIFYSLFHHEPIRAARLRPPYTFPPDTPQGDFANMGMASALFARDASTTRKRLAGLGLALRGIHYRDVAAYPASGGFSGPRILPTSVIRVLLAIDRRLPQFLLRLVALRMIIVLERAET